MVSVDLRPFGSRVRLPGVHVTGRAVALLEETAALP